LNELRLLCEAAGAEVVSEMIARARRPDPATFIGRGKCEELRLLVAHLAVDLVILDHDISPVQERNLELALKSRVLSRTGLILDIFAARASTHEGKLQVELAQLDYLSTRLVRGWSHLERQKGGIGLRGPGETQLETDRRLIDLRVRMLHKRLDKVHAQRRLQRKSRARAALPTVSLVGYTNAGKSSLFNALTHAGVDVADQMFKTLDPVMRKCQLDAFGPVIFSDTVGFIRQLPHSLVNAFHSTLEEVTSASLLLHVVDDSSEERDELIGHVDKVLEEIGAIDVPRLMVYNKIDLSASRPGARDGGRPGVWVSAHSGDGMNALKQAIGDRLGAQRQLIELTIGPSAAGFRAALYRRMTVLEETNDEQGCWHIRALASDAERGWLLARAAKIEAVILEPGVNVHI
jgi:GTP-binding protein HflX